MKFFSIFFLAALSPVMPLIAQTSSSSSAVKDLMEAVEERHDAAEEAIATAFKLMNDYHNTVTTYPGADYYSTANGGSSPFYYAPTVTYRDSVADNFAPPEYVFDLTTEDYPTAAPAHLYLYPSGDTTKQQQETDKKNAAVEAAQEALDEARDEEFTPPTTLPNEYEEGSSETLNVMAYHRALWTAWVSTRKAWIQSGETTQPQMPVIDKQTYHSDPGEHPDLPARREAYLDKLESDWEAAQALKIKRLERAKQTADGTVTSYTGSTDKTAKENARTAAVNSWSEDAADWLEAEKISAANTYKTDCAAYAAKYQSAINSESFKQAREKFQYLYTLANGGGGLYPCGVEFQKASIDWTNDNPSGPEQEIVALNEIAKHLNRISGAYAHMGKVNTTTDITNSWSFDFNAGQSTFLPIGIVTFENSSTRILEIQERIRRLDTLRWPMLLRNYKMPITIHANAIQNTLGTVDIGENAPEACEAGLVTYFSGMGSQGPQTGLYLGGPSISCRAKWTKTLGQTAGYADFPNEYATLATGDGQDIAAIKGNLSGRLFLASTLHNSSVRHAFGNTAPPLVDDQIRLHEFAAAPPALGGNGVNFSVTVENEGPDYDSDPMLSDSDNKKLEGDHIIQNLTYKIEREYGAASSITRRGLPDAVTVSVNLENQNPDDDPDSPYKTYTMKATGSIRHTVPGSQVSSGKDDLRLSGESVMLFSPSFSHVPEKPFALTPLTHPEPVFKLGGGGLQLEIPLPIADAAYTTSPRLALLLSTPNSTNTGGDIQYVTGWNNNLPGGGLVGESAKKGAGFWGSLMLDGDRSDLLLESQSPPQVTNYVLPAGVTSIYGDDVETLIPVRGVIKKITGSNGTLEIQWLGNYRFRLTYSLNGTEVASYEISAAGVQDSHIVGSLTTGTYPANFGQVTLKAGAKNLAKATVVGPATGEPGAAGEFARVEYFDDNGQVEITRKYVSEGIDPVAGTHATSVITQQRGASPVTDRFLVSKYGPSDYRGNNFLPAAHGNRSIQYAEFIGNSPNVYMATGGPNSPSGYYRDIGMEYFPKYHSSFMALPGASASSYLPHFRHPKSMALSGSGWAADGETLTYDHSGRLTNRTFKIAGMNASRAITRSGSSITDTTVVGGTTLAVVNTSLPDGLTRVVTTQDGISTTTDYYAAASGGVTRWKVKSHTTLLGTTSYTYSKDTDSNLITLETFVPAAAGPSTVTTTKVNKFGMLVSSNVKRGGVLVASADASGHTSNAFRRPTSIVLFSSGVTRTRTLEYHSDGSVKRIDDGNGTVDMYEWDILGRLKSGTSLDGRPLTPSYNGLADSFVLNNNTPIEETISSEVDVYGKLKEFSTTTGVGVKIAKAGTGETYNNSAANEGNRGFAQTFTTDGFPTVTGGGAGSPGTNVSYSTATVNGKGCVVITSTVVSEGANTPSVTKRYIDGLGRLVRVHEPHPMGSGTVNTDYTYDVGARKVTITPPSPAQPIVTTYDAGWMRAVTTQGSTSNEVSAANSVVGGSADTTITVKNAGREIYSQAVSLSNGQVTTRLNGRNATATTSTPNGNGTETTVVGPGYDYTATFNRHGLTGMSGNMAERHFQASVNRDGRGVVTAVSADPPGPKGSTSYSFSKAGRLTAAVGAGTSLGVSYNYAGGGVEATGTNSANLRGFTFKEGSEGQPLRMASTGRNDFTVQGNALQGESILKAAGFGVQQVSYSYGPQGHLLGITRSDGSTVSQTWRADGSLGSVTRSDSAGSNTFAMAYDPATGYPSGYSTTNSSVAITPNTDGTIASSTFTSKDIDNQTQSYSVSYPSYFDDSPKVETYGGTLSGYEVRRDYNEATGEISKVELLKNSAVIHSVTYAPNGYSQIGTVTKAGGSFTATYADGTNTEAFTAGAVTSTRTSLGDGSGRLSSVSTTAGGNTYSATYGFSGQNRSGLTLAAPGQPTTTWSYTFSGTGSTGQLQTASSNQGISYSYNHDAAGNRTTGTTTANGANQYTLFQIPGSRTATVAGKVVPGATVKISANGGPAQSVAVAADGTFSHSFAISSTGTSATSIPVEVVATLPGAGDAGADAIAAEERAVVVPPGNWSNTYGAHGALASDWRWIYRWDPEGRLIGMETQTAAASAGMPKLRMKFAYDDIGRRIGKTVLHLSASGAVQRTVSTKFIYDEWRLLAEETTDSAVSSPVLTFYTWGRDVSGSLGRTGGVGGLIGIHRNGASYVPVYDANGNVTALVHSATGAKVASWTRGPFGEPLSDSGATDLCAFGFATHYTDAETGLVYFGHRFYSPATGRWLSREPLGETESFNLYAYCHNDPVNKIDALGLFELAQDAPSNADIEATIAQLSEGIEANEKWLNRNKSFAEWLGELLDGTGNLAIQTDQDRQQIKFLKTILKIRSSIGPNDYGTLTGWSVARKYFGDNLPEEVVSKYLKPAPGLLTTASFREFSRIQDQVAEIVLGVSVSALPMPNPLALLPGGRGSGAILSDAAELAAKEAGERGTIYNVTDDFSKVVSSGRVWGQTEGSVYGMKSPNAPRWRTMADPPLRDPGTIIFEGQAATLFKPHPTEGLYSGLKRVLGQQKAGFGDIVFDTTTSTTRGNILIIRNAYLAPHVGQSSSWAAARLWGRRLGIDFPITTGTGYLLYKIADEK